MLCLVISNVVLGRIQMKCCVASCCISISAQPLATTCSIMSITAKSVKKLHAGLELPVLWCAAFSHVLTNYIAWSPACSSSSERILIRANPQQQQLLSFSHVDYFAPGKYTLDIVATDCEKTEFFLQERTLCHIMLTTMLVYPSLTDSPIICWSFSRALGLEAKLPCRM